jgi:CBS domain containing-hemolysin-like protein
MIFFQDDLLYSKIDEFNYLFDGKTNLNDLYRSINIKDESVFENKKGDSETIAGFILEQMGYFPKKKRICFKNKQCEVYN